MTAPRRSDVTPAEVRYVWPLELWLATAGRALLQAEIDAAVLHLYGLTRPQAEWVLDSSTVLRKYEESDLGEFLTKRMVLEIYDAMAEAMPAGTPYRTRLDPPPVDLRCCHPTHGGSSA